MIAFQIIYWRDIPVQVRVKNGRSRLTHPLSPRFQEAVHRAAFRAKAINGFDYIQEWRPSEWQEREGEDQDVITAVTAELETAYSDERLEKIARNKGYNPDGL
jgi:hypothetical protein